MVWAVRCYVRALKIFLGRGLPPGWAGGRASEKGSCPPYIARMVCVRGGRGRHSLGQANGLTSGRRGVYGPRAGSPFRAPLPEEGSEAVWALLSGQKKCLQSKHHKGKQII